MLPEPRVSASWRASVLLAVSLVTILAAGICGCGSSNASGAGANAAQTAPVSVSMTDDPPSGVAVLFFQVDLTAASLQSSSGSSVSLLPGSNPVTVDVTRLQALSAFLGSADIPADTYSSLSLTFANPQLVIYNVSDSSLGSSCAVGTVCRLTPTIDNSATVTLNSSPLPVTVSSGSPLGLLVDFHLNTVIQSDLSVNLGAANGVTIAELPMARQPRLGFLNGAVTAVNAGSSQFTLETVWGAQFTVDTSSSTTFSNIPAGSGSSTGLGGLASGDIVSVQISGVAGRGVVDASQVSYLASANNLVVQGTVVGVNPGGGSTGPSINLVLQEVPSLNAKLPPGSRAQVSIESGAAFTVDDGGVTLPGGLSFASASDLIVGQQVEVTVDASTLVASTATASVNGWGPPPSPSFSTAAVQLEPGQITGGVGTLSSTGFTLDSSPFFFGWWSFAPKVEATIDTTAQTTFQGFSSDDLTGVAAQDVVSVSGWLFATPAPAATTPSSARRLSTSTGSTTPPTIVAQTITLHPGGWF